MTDLPFDFSETLEAFTCPEPIQVYEKTGEYVDGYWKQTVGPKRELYCILLNVDEEKLEIVAKGRHVDAAFAIMFPAEEDRLFYTLRQNANVQSKQTYVEIDGLEFVVVNNPETVKNAGFRSYYALRFTEPENLSEDTNA